jgi:cytochrome bd-type quinol oxidase subunit 1
MNIKLVAAVVLLAVGLGISAYRSVYEMVFALMLCVSFIIASFSALVLLNGQRSRVLYCVAGLTSAVLLGAIAASHTVFVRQVFDHAMDVQVGTAGGLTIALGATAGIWSSSLRLGMQRLGLIS